MCLYLPTASSVAYLDLELFQRDKKTSFLNGNPEEGIYMDQPIIFVLKRQEDKVAADSYQEWLQGLSTGPTNHYKRF